MPGLHSSTRIGSAISPSPRIMPQFSGNPFVGIDRGVPHVFQQREHPLRPLDDPKSKPIQTNKFYANLLLADRNLPAFLHPYSVWWSRTDENLLGMAVSHTTESQRVYGPDPNANPVQYYFNPAGIQSFNFGATEFTKDNVSMTTDNYGPLSVDVRLRSGNGSIYLPLASGLGMVTGVYEGLTPHLQSLVGFRSVQRVGDIGNNVAKWELQLFNSVRWLMYVSGNGATSFQFQQRDNNHLVGSGVANGLVIQVVSCPAGADMGPDAAAGCYVRGARIEGNINGDSAMYRLKYATSGSSISGKPLLMALPHHVESFSPSMNPMRTNLQLDSTCMGKMLAGVSDVLEMEEKELPVRVGFLPWAHFVKHGGDDDMDLQATYSSDDINLLRQAAHEELNGDVDGQTNLDSMYFSGKGLDKFAFILIVTKYIVRDDDLTKMGLEKLKKAFAVFAENRQKNPLAYDTLWRGLVSVAGGQDPNADFGNTYYNDHHFHYGYFFHAAAVIGQIDRDYGGRWIEDNKQYVNALLRDVANYDPDDDAFPISRSFDWFVGHSWAKGLFLSGDGKDEESSSEDYHFAYGVKLWGRVIGDGAMEARGNLMLAVMRRAMNKYMLYADENCEQPACFKGNKVSGITFENKIDHATYFGLNPEYIHGIHMIPITPISSWVRSSKYVKEEWDRIISGIVDSVDSGWKGILILNQALYDPAASFSFFADSNFNRAHLDGGMSRTWSIAFAKGVC